MIAIRRAEITTAQKNIWARYEEGEVRKGFSVRDDIATKMTKENDYWTTTMSQGKR